VTQTFEIGANLTCVGSHRRGEHHSYAGPTLDQRHSLSVIGCLNAAAANRRRSDDQLDEVEGLGGLIPKL
jgi:hypothetical protein